jgi:hypothetical protein
MLALFIPTDPAEPVDRVDVDGLPNIYDLLGGDPEPTRYDLDAQMLVLSTGRIDGLPLNVRATHYIKTASLAAQQRPALAHDKTGYGLYGPVVVIGLDFRSDVPERIVQWFEAG